MRIISGILAALLFLFAGVQYNDPDFYFWGPVYAIPASWALLATISPSFLQGRFAVLLFGICAISAVVGLIYFWPVSSEWWRPDIWWDDEGAREGMGLMIVTGVFIFLAIMRTGRRT